MIIRDEAFVMLLTDPFFRGFTKKEPRDTTKSNEALLALSWSFYDIDGHHWEVLWMDLAAVQ